MNFQGRNFSTAAGDQHFVISQLPTLFSWMADGCICRATSWPKGRRVYEVRSAISVPDGWVSKATCCVTLNAVFFLPSLPPLLSPLSVRCFLYSLPRHVSLCREDLYMVMVCICEELRVPCKPLGPSRASMETSLVGFTRFAGQSGKGEEQAHLA